MTGVASPLPSPPSSSSDRQLPESDLLDDTNKESVDIVVQLSANLDILDSVSLGQTPRLCGEISSNPQL